MKTLRYFSSQENKAVDVPMTGLENLGCHSFPLRCYPSTHKTCWSKYIRLVLVFMCVRDLCSPFNNILSKSGTCNWFCRLYILRSSGSILVPRFCCPSAFVKNVSCKFLVPLLQFGSTMSTACGTQFKREVEGIN